MPKINVTVQHTLGQEEASSRLQRLTEYLKSMHGDKVTDLSETWSGHAGTFGFSTFGMKVAGNIAAEADKVVLEGEIPFAAMMFKGKIEQEIRGTLEKALGVGK
jgi:hypothetical protein